jgi:DNA helicase-2/ATP-dependent DNA helicase PcrA
MKTKFNNAELRQQDLLQLGAFSKKFASTEEFLAQLSLLSEVESDGEKTGKQGGVSLSTCHQAKGLEWKTVFGLWMTQGVFPSYRVLENWEEAMIEEERRLFYVLVTRAMDHLYLVSPRRNPMSRTGDFRCAISQFIEELGKDKLEKIRVS